MKKVLLLSFVMLFVLFYIVNSDIVSAKSSMNKVNVVDKWEWPAEGVLTDHFGTREGTHFGLDIAADPGDDIRVVEEGTISKSYYSDSYGHVIFVKHPNGMETVYAHMSKRLAKEGEEVEKGSVIGLIGNTGKSRGAHLHFEVHTEGWNVHKTNAVDPMAFLENAPLHVSVNSRVKEHEAVSITVAPGDTLWGISQEYEISVEDLMLWNNLESDLIVPGEALFILKQMT